MAALCRKLRLQVAAKIVSCDMAFNTIFLSSIFPKVLRSVSVDVVWVERTTEAVSKPCSVGFNSVIPGEFVIRDDSHVAPISPQRVLLVCNSNFIQYCGNRFDKIPERCQEITAT